MHARESESEVGVSTRIYTFLAQAGLREQSESSAFLGILSIHKTLESRWKRLGLAGIAILAAVQSTLDALKSQKSGTWGCFVPTLTEVFELCYRNGRTK